MRTRLATSGALIVALAITAAVAAGLGVSAPTPASAARLETLTGWFHIVWTVPAQRGQPAQVNYLLVDDAGRATELLLDAGFAARYGVPESLDRQQVTVIVSPLGPRGARSPVRPARAPARARAGFRWRASSRSR